MHKTSTCAVAETEQLLGKPGREEMGTEPDSFFHQDKMFLVVEKLWFLA